MFPVPNPEPLARDWPPPVALGREPEVREVVRRLGPPAPNAPPPWIVAIAGPSGSGTSTVARRAAREVLEALRRQAAEPSPRLLAVRVAELRGAHGVATALLRLLDDGFEGRGFPVAEILAGLLRRLRRDHRPVVLVLDDVTLGGPDLGPVLRALVDPDRFLPEGESGLPPWWTILAGTPEGLVASVKDPTARSASSPWVPLAPYSADALTSIVRDRLERTVGRPPPSSIVQRIVAQAVEDGHGAQRAIELVRRELLGPPRARGPGGGRGPAAVRVEPWVVDALEQASRGSAARLGDIRRLEAVLARRRGVVPLATTTLWRRILRLERAGYLRREIRTGGAGGTRSVIRLLTPVDEWVMSEGPTGTHRDVGYPSSAPSPAREPPPAGRGPGWGSPPDG